MNDTRAEIPVAPLLGVAVLAGLFAAGYWIGVGVTRPLSFEEVALLVVAVLVTELLPIRLPRGRAVATSSAVLGTGALVGVDALQLATLAAVAWLAARAIDGQLTRWSELVVRTGSAAALGAAAAVGRQLSDPWLGATGSDLRLDLYAAAAVAVVLVAVVPWAEALAGERGRRASRRLADELRVGTSARVAVAATAILGALVHGALGPWTLPSVLVPLLAARVGLERFAGVTVAYDQTIRAMSRLPEQLGVVETDHGVRVGQLAVAVADRLGLDLAARVELERAGHLHELGHIRFEPGDRPSRGTVAAAGARVIASAGNLDRVAAIVAAHGDAAVAESSPPDIARSASIVAACCTLALRPDAADTREGRAALTLDLVAAHGDLEVVRALLEVVDGPRQLSATGPS